MARTTSVRSTKTEVRQPAKAQSNPDKYFSRALEKGLQALQTLNQSAQGMTLTATAQILGLTKASAFRILRTLEALGYAEKSDDGRYTVTGVARSQVPSRSIQGMLQHGSEPLQNLAFEFRETASMAALFENHIEVILVLESPQLIRMGNTVGRILPPHASSMGKATTAFQERADCQRLLRSYGTSRFTDNTMTDEMGLQKEFERIRAAGHAEDWEESTPGGVCFAAPILRPDRVAVGAVSLSLPKMRLESKEHQQRIIRSVAEAAANISLRVFSTET